MSIEGQPYRPVRCAVRSAALRSGQRGVTIIELMITIAILAVLLGLAVPSFQEFVIRSRLDSAAQEMLTTLQFARSEAIRRGAQVSLRRTSSSSGKWGDGWSMFIDADSDGELDDGEKPPIREGRTLGTSLTLNASGNLDPFIAFDRTGRASSGGGQFVLCYGDAPTEDGRSRSRAVVLSPGGGVRLAQQAEVTTCTP